MLRGSHGESCLSRKHGNVHRSPLSMVQCQTCTYVPLCSIPDNPSSEFYFVLFLLTNFNQETTKTTKMDLSNVVFLESQPTKTKKKTTQNKTNKTALHKKQRRKVKANKPDRMVVEITDRSALKTKQRKKNGKAQKKPQQKAKARKEAEFPPANWVKVPPANGEPNTKQKNGKTYHWCHHCKYWGLHLPGKGKLCQAVDPLAHLLSYFGGRPLVSPSQQPQTRTQPDENSLMDIDL